jgi:hypothetical protein
MSQAHYTGRCACGSVHYECGTEPLRMFNCHCRDCQRGTGSGYSALVLFRRDAVKVTGDIKYHSSTSERGTVLDRGFCPNCGNPISMLSKANPGICAVYASSLDDPTLYKPAAQLWIRSSQPWDKFDQAVQCHDMGFP